MCYLDRLVPTFVADCLSGLKGNQEYSTRNAIERLHQVLDRRPKASDLTAANIAKVLRRLASDGFTVPPIKKYRTTLVRLARYCHRRGLLDEMPATPKMPQARKKARKLATAPPGSLAHEFATKLIDRHLPTASRKQLNDFQAAIAQFGRWLGHDATMADVSEESLRSFAAVRTAAGHNERYTADKCYKLWRVCHWMDPEQFPDRRFNVALPPALPGTLREFFESSYHPLRMLGMSQARYYEYQMSIRKLNEFAGREVLLEELTDTLIAGFMSKQLEKGVLPITINGCRARLLALWRFAFELGKLERLPRLKKLPVALDAPDAWSEEELKRIFAAPLKIDWQRDIAGVPLGAWLHALLLTCYWTALRRRTLLHLRREHVNLTDGWVNIPGDIMKSRRGKRIRLGADALAALHAIWLPERELLFPFPHDGTTLSKYLRRVLKVAEIPPSSRKSMTQLHKMRRSVATLTAQKRGITAASELLGHSDTQITLRYIDPSKQVGSDFTEVLPTLTGPAAAPPGEAAATALDRASWKPAEYFAEAEQLAAAGHLSAACMTARIAMERALRKRFSRRIGGKVRDTSLSKVIHRLACEGHLSKAQAAGLKKASATANRVAHGGAIDPAELGGLLATIRALLNDPEGGSAVASA